ncbi:MAG: hypothetical protein ABI844_16450 [Saprospiraceae bacterium]
MKSIFIGLVIFSFCYCNSASPSDTDTLRSILLEQLKTTHNNKDWFVPINQAIEGLTSEQASWTDGSGNHSIAQLTNHLIFWNQQQLSNFKGEKKGAFSGDNNETFSTVD